MSDYKSSIYKIVESKINHLENIKNDGLKNQYYANLRRGAGRDITDVPQNFGILFEGLSDRFLDNDKFINAVYYSMTLYATAQQGKDKSMHCEGAAFGAAVSRLADYSDEDSVERISKKLGMAITAKKPEELELHLRTLIKLLKTEDIALDFAELADDIYSFRYPDSRKEVRLKWGRDFYKALYKQRQEAEKTKNDKE